MLTPTQRQRINAAVAEALGRRYWKETRGSYTLCVGELHDGREPWASRRTPDPERYTRVTATEAAKIGFFGEGIPDYCGSWSGMGMVVEELKDRFDAIALVYGKESGTWHCDLATTGNRTVTGYHKKAPVAVALAALRALGQGDIVYEIMGDSK